MFVSLQWASHLPNVKCDYIETEAHSDCALYSMSEREILISIRNKTVNASLTLQAPLWNQYDSILIMSNHKNNWVRPLHKFAIEKFWKTKQQYVSARLGRESDYVRYCGISREIL